jgi:uncharacterized membrane protein YgdD (TMEM256/DUF423 family)
MDPTPVSRVLAALGALNALLSIGMGAFAAHALKARLPERSLQLVETAARYQMYHALGLVLLAVLLGQGVRVSGPAWLMLAGIVLFSGSLYGIGVLGLPLGPVTPLGGLCFLASWAWVAVAALKH